MKSLRDEIDHNWIFDNVLDQASYLVIHDAWAQVLDDVWDQVVDQIRFQLWTNVRNQLDEEFI